MGEVSQRRRLGSRGGSFPKKGDEGQSGGCKGCLGIRECGQRAEQPAQHSVMLTRGGTGRWSLVS